MAFNINQRLNGLEPLAYAGVNAVQPPDFVTKPRPPTANDSKNFYLGQIWLDTGTNTPPTASDIYMLVALLGNQATWVTFGGGALQTLTGNSGGPVSPDGAFNINVVGDNVGIIIAGNPGTNTLTASLVGGGVAAQSFITNPATGIAVPTAAGVLTFAGSAGLVPSAAGSTVTYTLGGSVAQSFLTNAGTAVPAAGVLTVLGAHGLNTSGAASTVTVAINNAITLGDLAPIAALTPGLTMTTGDIIFSGSVQAAATTQMINFTSGGANNRIFFYLNNIFIGSNTGNTTMTPGVALFNVGIGIDSLSSLTTGERNTALGETTLSECTTGIKNTGLGYNALSEITTGSRNTQVGASDSIVGITTGSDNVFIGFGTGANYTGAESGNILIGSGVSGVVGESNKTKIGGIRGVTTTNADAIAVLIDSAGQLGTVSSSRRYKENISDMGSYSDVLRRLRPVTFNYKSHSPESISVGLIAEEVEEVAPQLVVYDKDGLPETVKYHDLVPMLLNEQQQHCKLLADQQAIIADLMNRVKLLEEDLIKRSCC